MAAQGRALGSSTPNGPRAPSRRALDGGRAAIEGRSKEGEGEEGGRKILVRRPSLKRSKKLTAVRAERAILTGKERTTRCVFGLRDWRER